MKRTKHHDPQCAISSTLFLLDAIILLGICSQIPSIHFLPVEWDTKQRRQKVMKNYDNRYVEGGSLVRSSLLSPSSRWQRQIISSETMVNIYHTSHPRRQPPPLLLMWEPQISQINAIFIIIFTQMKCTSIDECYRFKLLQQEGPEMKRSLCKKEHWGSAFSSNWRTAGSLAVRHLRIVGTHTS